ncbi:MAG: class I SAM-dependent methyltransferase [Kineosporiaceae bacterium]
MAEQRRPEGGIAGGFDGGVEPWLRGLGQVRDVVRQHLVARQVAEVVAATGRTALRAIDVGCGQGTQALGLARAGHEVVCLDPSAALLEVLVATLGGEPDEVRGRVRVVTGTGEDAPSLVGGGFDLVLCHGVLMYLDDDAGLLDALARMTGPDGRLSLLVRNGDALGLRPGLLGDWAAVPAAVDADGYENRLGLRARAHRLGDLDNALGARGLRRERWWGVRVLCDHLDGPAPDGDRLDALLAAERAVAGRDPYRSVAALTHAVYGRAVPGT